MLSRHAREIDKRAPATIEETMSEQSECPSCHSKDPQKFQAWSTAFGGGWIPWFRCDDEWHKEQEATVKGKTLKGAI
jgi:hypothetical protein